MAKANCPSVKLKMFRERIVGWKQLSEVWSSFKEFVPIALAGISLPTFYVRFKETELRLDSLDLRLEPSRMSARSAQFNR